MPTFIAHGRHDPLIPFSQGERLAQASRHAQFVPMECAHSDCPPDWESFMKTVSAFLERSKTAGS